MWKRKKNRPFFLWACKNISVFHLQGSSGEVHCEKVTCPVLTCSHPVRRHPSDCCKECPEEEKTPPGLEHGDMMQADGPRHCKFGKNYYQNSDNWHPWVPMVGEMKCINCWCDVSGLILRKLLPSVESLGSMSEIWADGESQRGGWLRVGSSISRRGVSNCDPLISSETQILQRDRNSITIYFPFLNVILEGISMTSTFCTRVPSLC